VVVLFYHFVQPVLWFKKIGDEREHET